MDEHRRRATLLSYLNPSTPSEKTVSKLPHRVTLQKKKPILPPKPKKIHEETYLVGDPSVNTETVVPDSPPTSQRRPSVLISVQNTPRSFSSTSLGPPVPKISNDRNISILPPTPTQNSADYLTVVNTTADKMSSVSDCPDSQTVFKTVEEKCLTLSELTRNHSESFPLKVQVHQGYSTAGDEKQSISSGEIFNIHFLKEMKYVTITDVSSNQYRILMNSAVEFGVVYNQQMFQCETVTFETVGDIITSAVLPEVICARRTYLGHSQKSSVKENEILVVQGVQKSMLGFGKQTLKAFSISTMEEKALSKDCTGSFSTDPYLTRLHLPELLMYVHMPLPMKVKIFFDLENEHGLPKHLASSLVTITEENSEQSLIATPELSTVNNSGLEGLGILPTGLPIAHLIELPLSLEVKVSVIETATTDLCTYTQELYENISEIMGSCKFTKVAPQVHTQTSTWKGHELEGQRIELPLKVLGTQKQKHDHVLCIDRNKPYQSLMLPNEETPLLPKYESLHFSDTINTQSHHQAASRVLQLPPELPPRQFTLPRSEKPLPVRQDAEIEKLSNKIRLMQQTLNYQQEHLIELQQNTVQSDIQFVKSELQEVTMTVNQLTHNCRQIMQDMDQLKEKLACMSFLSEQHKMVDSEEAKKENERNKVELSRLKQSEVLLLLDSMGMKEYRDKFAQQSVDGELLLDLDDEILEVDLGVTSKLHRLKLRKLISGQYSAKSILESSASYVLFNKRQAL